MMDGGNGRPVVRDGVREDAVHLTRVVHTASEGFAYAMWQSMAEPGEDPWEFGRKRALRDSGGLSWRNARVCQLGDRVAGALIGYHLGDEVEEIGPDTPQGLPAFD
jgi:hypothetical protein